MCAGTLTVFYCLLSMTYAITSPKYLHKAITISGPEFSSIPVLTITGIKTKLECVGIFVLRNTSADASNSMKYNEQTEECEIGIISPATPEVNFGEDIVVPSRSDLEFSLNSKSFHNQLRRV